MEWDCCRNHGQGHPRTCGGTRADGLVIDHVPGSSPHLRGNLEIQSENLPVVRVIPAPAGEPWGQYHRRQYSQGHPRTCGGTRFWRGHVAPDLGSSPHLRGNLLAGRGPDMEGRVIPAPAGEPACRRGLRPPSSGHPRTCGGTLPKCSFTIGSFGSSPHLRGNRAEPFELLLFTGVIPAPAGEPSRGVGKGEVCPGHPRTCGGTHCGRFYKMATAGSSPHLRGNPSH